MYKLTPDGRGVTRTVLGVFEYLDIADERYIKWLAAGNTPLPVDPPTAEQLAALALTAADKAEADNAKADAAVQYLLTHTLAQINTYVRGQVVTTGITDQVALAAINSLTTLVVKLACVVSVLGKDKLR